MKNVGIVFGWILSILFVLFALGQINHMVGLIAVRGEYFYLDLSISLMMLTLSIAGALVFNPPLFKRLPLAKGPIGRTAIAIGIVLLAAIGGLLLGDFVVGPRL